MKPSKESGLVSLADIAIPINPWRSTQLNGLQTRWPVLLWSTLPNIQTCLSRNPGGVSSYGCSVCTRETALLLRADTSSESLFRIPWRFPLTSSFLCVNKRPTEKDKASTHIFRQRHVLLPSGTEIATHVRSVIIVTICQDFTQNLSIPKKQTLTPHPQREQMIT